MAKIRAAKLTRISNISRPTVYPLNTPAIERNLEWQRSHVQLRNYLDRAQYTEARVLFSEIIKTAKYPLESIWKIGVEIISKTSSNDLTDYLKAVYIGSSESLAPITFNVYIDQLMIIENWDLALEEMELLYHRPAFHHPILLRKMAFCSYNQWKAAKEKLPETYFEDEDYDADDSLAYRYVKLTRTASKYLAEAHKVYKLDVELLDIYLIFLNTATDRDKKEVISITLQAFKQNPDRYMLSYLLKINQDDQYFKSKPFVLHMYECDPSLKPNEMLKQYIEKTCKQISRLKKKETPNADKMLKFEKRLQRIYLIFLAQLESNNANKSFVKLIRKNLFKRAISRQVCEAYQRSSAYQLMRSSYDKKIKGLAKTIKQDVKKYLKRDMIDHNQSKEEEQIVIKLEGEQENNIDCAEKESIIEMNNEDYMHVRTELSLFQKYLQHPLFNNTK